MIILKIDIFYQLIRQMGVRVVLFRLFYELQRKTGILKLHFPTSLKPQTYSSLNQWKNNARNFFFKDRTEIQASVNNNQSLKQEKTDILNGIYTYFYANRFEIGNNYNWMTNPVNHFTYNVNLHWSKIKGFSLREGDIKYVWELSRFSFLYTLMRYDHHFSEDTSEFVFGKIINWIDKNPLNQGPNYICSQEISIRILNWTFALYYYRFSGHIKEKDFQKILHSIRGQLKHVYSNINFSRIALRNNHTITETLTLYIGGLLYPFFPESKKWKKKGRKWFEQEIKYQIYDDGTYLQFSMNYQRVVLQLLTWGIRLAELNDEPFDEEVYNKARKSVSFLYNCMNLINGYLPNYGANDGALFFKLNNNDYRDFRGQLQALSYILRNQDTFNWSDYLSEDLFWYGLSPEKKRITSKSELSQILRYPVSGYYIIREKSALTFIRCGKHKNRPSQADNLHLDIWYKGSNYLIDCGSYLYNTHPDFQRYFAGTKSHNTVMLDDYDQMRKGPHFIWIYWTQALEARIDETDHSYIFIGIINAFNQLKKNILHKRIIVKFKNIPKWLVTDEIVNMPGVRMNQLWHPHPDLKEHIRLSATDVNGENLIINNESGWYSDYYGVKESSDIWIFKTSSNQISTMIEINNR